MADEPKLDWSSAEVSDGKLSVAVDGKLSSAWKGSFETVAQLLNHGDWPAIKLKKGTVTVEDVRPGDEEKLRHFLESVLLQANADQRPPDEQQQEPDEDDDRDQRADESEPSQPDEEMATRFREFAEGAGDTE
jgi:hypothetical protein